MDTNEFTTWLMDTQLPSIEYLALTDLFHFPADETRVIQARREIMKSLPVTSILSQQSEEGNWEGERSYYTPKYVSTHWSLMLLAELCVDGSDPRFQQGVRFMLEKTAEELEQWLQKPALGSACFWGNLLRYALHAGQGRDERVRKVIFLTTRELLDGSCRCRHNADHPCAWGVVRGLWGLAAIPKTQCTPETDQAIAQGVKFLLESYHLVKANYPTSERNKIHSLWFKLNFPLFYQADILFTLSVLDELEMLDHPGAQAALNWLEQRRSQNGRWPSCSPYRLRTWKELGDREETNRWVSLQASRILLHADRIPEFQFAG